jgi:hypothetical protein
MGDSVMDVSVQTWVPDWKEGTESAGNGEQGKVKAPRYGVKVIEVPTLPAAQEKYSAQRWRTLTSRQRELAKQAEVVKDESQLGNQVRRG